jgi:hypothetical protein
MSRINALKPPYAWAFSRSMKTGIVIVVGMHRSGTGLVAKILQDLGVFIGKELTGNQESVFFQSLNKDALDVIGCNWRCLDYLPPVNDLEGGWEWLSKFVRRRLEARLIEAHFGFTGILRMLKKDFAWGWKDPRNALLLPVWRSLMPQARIVHVLRDGRDAALSLLRRDLKRHRGRGDLTIENQRQRYSGYFALWESYIRRIEEALPDCGPTHRIRFEQLLDHPMDEIEKLAGALGMKCPITREAAEGMVDRSRKARYREHGFEWVSEITPAGGLLAELEYD